MRILWGFQDLLDWKLYRVDPLGVLLKWKYILGTKSRLTKLRFCHIISTVTGKARNVIYQPLGEASHLSGYVEPKGLIIWRQYMNQMTTRKTAILVDGGFYRKRAEYLWGKKKPQSVQMSCSAIASYILTNQKSRVICIVSFTTTALLWVVSSIIRSQERI